MWKSSWVLAGLVLCVSNAFGQVTEGYGSAAQQASITQTGFSKCPPLQLSPYVDYSRGEPGTRPGDPILGWRYRTKSADGTRTIVVIYDAAGTFSLNGELVSPESTRGAFRKSGSWWRLPDGQFCSRENASDRIHQPVTFCKPAGGLLGQACGPLVGIY